MRAVFAVALTVAILAVTLPAVDTVSVDRATTETQGSVERLVLEARTLAAGNDALPTDSEAARRIVALDLPQSGFASAPLVSLTVGPPEAVARAGARASTPDESVGPVATRITWRVEGGERQVRQFDDIRLRSVTGDRFELKRGGTQRLVLRFVARDGKPVVTVSSTAVIDSANPEIVGSESSSIGTGPAGAMYALLARLTGDDAGDTDCRCRPRIDGDRLVVDANDCPSNGRLAEAPACRKSVVEALTVRDVESVVTRTARSERAYEDGSAALLVAAGRFADAVAFHDERLAARVLHDPLGAAREATGRAGPISRLAAETGLAGGTARVDGYADALRPFVGPTVSRWRVAARPPSDARLADKRALESKADVRVYDRSGDAVRTYHLDPLEHRLGESALETLSRAYERLADGTVDGEDRAPGRAVRAVAAEDDPVADIRSVLSKHTRGYGVVEDLFADERVSDVFATAPVTANPLWVRVDGEAMRTNVRLTDSGADALASRFRRESGRAFSGADPTLDATVATGSRRVRVAGVTDPTSDGVAFAFRARDSQPWTLPAMVANGTLSADAAAFLSVAVERGAAGLIAGPRGAGKTTLLGSLLWEVPPSTRTIVIEDTPELPVEGLQTHGRDVQGLQSALDETGPSPTETLRTALRLGEGALVVGEIRGEEAATLYEAMRVGANDGAVLGTIHGDGGADVRERVVTDLGVPESSFAVTDLLVSLETHETRDDTARRVRTIEEVRYSDGDVSFTPLFERSGDGLSSTGCLDRGNSRVVQTLAGAEESYADLRAAIQSRESWLVDLAGTGRSDPAAVEQSRAKRIQTCADAHAEDGPVATARRE